MHFYFSIHVCSNDRDSHPWRCLNTYSHYDVYWEREFDVSAILLIALRIQCGVTGTSDHVLSIHSFSLHAQPRATLLDVRT